MDLWHKFQIAALGASLLAAQTGGDLAKRLDQAADLQRKGAAREARKVLGELIPRLREAGDPGNLARALSLASEAAFTLGEYAAAAQGSAEAAALYAKSHNQELEAEAWNTVGRAGVYLGKYEEAVASYQRALTLDRQRGDGEGEIVRLYNIGNVYFEQGRYLDAYRQYQAALGRMEAKPDPLKPDVAKPDENWKARRRQIVLANQALLYQRLGQYQKALDAYLALRAAAASMRASERAQLLANMGTLYRRLGDAGKALETYREAQRLFAQDRHPFGEIGALKNTGIALALDLGRLPEALRVFDQAGALARESAPGQLAAIQLYIGETLRQMRRYDEARRHFEAALAQSRQGGSNEYEWRALFGLGQIEEQAGRPAQALRLYNEAIERIESVRSGLDLPVLRREFLADKRRVYDAALANLLARPDPPIETVFALMENSRARTLQDRLSGTAGKPGLKDVQSRLDAGTLLLEYWTSETFSAVLFATRSQAGVQVRPAVDVTRLREALGGTGADWRALSAQAGRALLDGLPLWRDGATRNLIVVPDGALSLIPFEALVAPGTEDGGGKLLVERAAVFYSPSASLLLRSSWGKREGWSAPWRQQLLAFADPAAPAPGGGLFDTVGAGAERWARLPVAPEEVRAIASLLAGRSQLHIGADARKQYLKVPAAARPPLLHVSTHATADYMDPERSRILFAPQQPKDGSDFLFLREVYSLDLKGLDLVVLSACDTETGKLVGGEGIEGFGKAFLAAGSRSTVTTLWRVEDRATAEFMKQFYFALASGMSKAEALRWAKLKLLRSGSKLAHPRYWAAFVLNGDGLAPIPRVAGWGTLAAAAGAMGLAAMAAVRLVGRRPRARAGMPADSLR